MATQYHGLLRRVLLKGRNNPYHDWESLCAWAHRTNDMAIRIHIAIQFGWPEIDNVVVKKWLTNCLSGLRVLKLVWPAVAA